jgi:GntR family transcriptional repressor for pyruvate dehydrogenase complex
MALASDPELFNRVSVERISHVIVEQVKLLIRDGKLVQADRLPSERELSQRFGVSRVTVREALRVLESSGLVEIRVGSRGGAFVTSPSAERLGEGLADLLTLSTLTPSDVTEARMVIETAILPLVVERATQQDIADLARLVAEGREALERNEYTMQLSAVFHISVSRCAHNPAIETLVQSFHGPMLMSLRQAQVAAPLMGHQGTEEHSAIVEAIARRDADAAVAVMRVHLDRTASAVAIYEAGPSSGSSD